MTEDNDQVQLPVWAWKFMKWCAVATFGLFITFVGSVLARAWDEYRDIRDDLEHISAELSAHNALLEKIYERIAEDEAVDRDEEVDDGN